MTLKTLTVWLALCVCAPAAVADLPRPPPPAAPTSAVAPAAASNAPAAAVETGGSSFQAADPSKFKENLDGLPFLVGSYAAIWIALFGFVVLVHRRAGKLEGEVQRLREDIARATRSGDAP